MAFAVGLHGNRLFKNYKQRNDRLGPVLSACQTLVAVKKIRCVRMGYRKKEINHELVKSISGKFGPPGG